MYLHFSFETKKIYIYILSLAESRIVLEVLFYKLLNLIRFLEQFIFQNI